MDPTLSDCRPGEKLRGGVDSTGGRLRFSRMYLPKHFKADDDETAALLAGLRVADLVTPTTIGLYATFLPLIHQGASGGFGSLLGHVARRNDHWRLGPVGESMVIAHGPDAYITPGWYESKREHGRVVPTWNYVTAHIYGELVIHDDPTWLEHVVRLLTDRHEATRTEPWSVDDAPRDFAESQLKAIVGIELKITRVEAKLKLGQNRSAADIDGVTAGLRARGDDALADATARARRA
jgi:transcriptional regulator